MQRVLYICVSLITKRKKMNLSNIDLNSLEIIGKGKNGIAYEYQNHVLKVTDNPYEGEAAKRLVKNPQPWSCKIYEVEEISDGRFFILKEMVQVKEYDPTDENGEFYGVEGTLESLQNTLHTPYQLCQLPQGYELRDLTKEEIKNIVRSQRTKLGGKVYEWFYRVFSSAEKFEIDTRDLYQNIGVNKDGEFVFFDVMIARYAFIPQ